MALRPTLGLQQRQRLGLTQEIKSSLQYLALAGLRLEQTLQDALDTNPFLTVSNTHSAQDEADWIAQLADPGPETLASALRALARDLFWQAEDRALANVLIDEVAETGLLARPLAEIDHPAGVTRADLHRVQTAFLAEGGLLADDMGQSLAAQARTRAAQGDIGADMLPAILQICDHLAEIRLGTYDPDPAALSAMQSLAAAPADRLDLRAAVILPPDLIVTQGDAGWHVRLNPLTHRHYGLDEEALALLTPAAQKRAEIADSLKVAKATVRAVQARGQTLIRLTTYVCNQQDAALRTDRSALAPLTQGETAVALDLHPSTISRAVAGKTVQTPRGVWALRDFFTALIDPETQLSGARLRGWLVALIEAEDPAAPLSDAALVSQIAARGPKVARRTITKYRLRLGLPSAAERKRAYARQTPSPTNRKEIL